jgi:hypothetical protein
MVNSKVINIFMSNKKYVILFSALYVAIIIFFSYNEHKKSKNKLEYDAIISRNQKIISTYSDEISLLTAIFDQAQESINKLTKVFKKTNKLDLREWDFESISTPICKGIYNTILSIAEEGDKFSVNIYIRFKRINKDKGESYEYVKMIAHEGNHKYQPKILGVRKLIKTYGEYLYIKQFINKNPIRTILLEREEIKRNFKFNGDYENYKMEYGQYIGIPIICKGNSMIALVEIIAHENSRLASTKDCVEDIISKYILPYLYFLQLSQRIEKNMKTTIEIMNKEGDAYGEE